MICDGISLFEWSPFLEERLEPHPDVRIVLSTSWVRGLSFSRARAWLPEALAKRVIGARWHSAMHQDWWLGLSLYEQISRHAQRHRLARWLAVDDDSHDWAKERSSQLIQTDTMLGIAAPDSCEMLQLRLREL